jgi:3-oxoadipate enol-lactonase
MELTTSDRTTLFFETYGDPADRPLVVIHGLGADHEMWAPQIETLPPQGFFLIAPDVRGHGRSSPVETFELQDCARDIAEILDHLEIPQATVAGVSMGGVIVQQFTCDFPDRLDRLVVSDSFSEIRTLMEKLAAWSNWLTLKLWPSLFSRAFEMAYRQPHMEQARDYFHEVFQEMDPQQVLQARVALNHFDIIDRLPAVDSPALVVVGDQFGAFAINMARKTADALPNAAFQVLEGGADPSNLTVPDEFDRAILDFLMDRKGKGN